MPTETRYSSRVLVLAPAGDRFKVVPARRPALRVKVSVASAPFQFAPAATARSSE